MTVLLTVQHMGMASSRLKVIASNILFLILITTLLGQIIRFTDQMMERRSEGQIAILKSSATANPDFSRL